MTEDILLVVAVAAMGLVVLVGLGADGRVEAEPVEAAVDRAAAKVGAQQWVVVAAATLEAKAGSEAEDSKAQEVIGAEERAIVRAVEVAEAAIEAEEDLDSIADEDGAVEMQARVVRAHPMDRVRARARARGTLVALRRVTRRRPVVILRRVTVCSCSDDGIGKGV